MSVNILKQGIINASGASIGINILSNSDFSQQYQETHWDTSKNGTTLATNWSGYNGSVANPTTVYHAHLKQFQGEWVYEYIRDNSETWLGVSQGGLQSYITPSTTYTWSIDEYRPSGSATYIYAGLYYKKTSDGNYGFWSGCPRGTYEDVYDKWVRKYYTFTTESEVYTDINIAFYIYGYCGANGTVYMRKPKLELGSIATPWNKTATEWNTSVNNHGIIESQTDKAHIYQSYIEGNEIKEI